MAASATCDRIFYDGGCGICHGSVAFVARHDPTGDAFRFAPLHGEVFAEIVGEEIGRALPDTMVVQTAAGDLLLRSEGVVYILRRLGPFWKLLGRLLALVPRPIRDFFYDRFAAGRRFLASKPAGACPLLPPELRQRFDP
ncbi:MAG: DCC1-like thiol-disulfide oxidoreductase family protein [Thermoanaerobaculia bacterium]